MKILITLCFFLASFFAKAQATLNLKFFIEGYYIGGGTTRTAFDSTTVELFHPAGGCNLIASSKGKFLSDGTMTCQFPSSVLGNYYYIRINHCNVLLTFSAAPVFFIKTTDYDFTDSQYKAACGIMTQIEPGIWALFSDDINHDGNFDLIDILPLDSGITQGQCNSSCIADLNGDGNVDLIDYPSLCQKIHLGWFPCPICP